MKTTEKILNLETGIETVIERDMLDSEIAEIEAAKNRVIEANKAQALREAAIAKLGLTPEEAQALLG